MPTLAINTASSHTAIALLGDDEGKKNGKLIAENSWQSQNDEAEKLMPAIDELLKSADKNYSDIKKIIVIKGPGSFTGLRVGVTVANTVAYLVGCDLYGIDTFEYFWNSDASARRERERGEESGFASSEPKQALSPNSALLIFAGSGGVYVSLGQNEEPELVNIDKINQYLKEKDVKKVFGDITEDQKKELEGIEFMETKETFGEIIQKIPTKNLKSEKLIKPNYIKTPSITKSKKTLFK